MDKLKKVFSPGSSKDDEVLYGDAEARRQASAGNAQHTSKQSDAEPLRPVEGHKESSGVMRQILNPGGEKYDDRAYGANATTEPVDPNHLQTRPEHSKDHTILGQILNPGGDKYDEKRFGETGTTSGDTRKESIRPEADSSAVVSPDAKLATDEQHKDHSILRQVINPGGRNYDSVAYGQNAGVVGAQEHQQLQNDPARQEDKSSISRQILNPNQERYDPVIHGAGQSSASGFAPAVAAASSTATTHGADHAQSSQQGSAVAGAGSSTLPDRSAQTTTTDGSHLGRDAAIVGGVGAAGAGTYAATRHPNEHQSVSEVPATAQSTASSAYSQPAHHSTAQPTYPQSTSEYTPQLSGTSATTGISQHNNPIDSTGSTSMTDRPHPLSNRGVDDHINPVSAPEARESQIDSHLGRDAAVVGGGGIAGGAAASHLHGSSQPIGATTNASGPMQLNQAPADVQNATYTERSTNLAGGAFGTARGPHQTDTANRLDPHVPGEFPTETGDDPHKVNPAPLYAGETTSAASAALPSQTQTTEPASDHHGRDAAFAGAGLVGTGAAASALSEHEPFAMHPGGQSHPVQAQPGAGITGSSIPAQTQGTQAQPEHHYGRDAALGGAGLAGVGTAAYGLSQHDSSRQTLGHSAPTTSDPSGQSVSAPPAGTSVAASSAPAQAHSERPTAQHQYGRDAAVAGGAGAAGLGAYEATKSHESTGPASKTIGPHESNVANVVDPRVQPDPQQMKQSTTLGPHQSDMANKADPRVDSSKHENGKEAAALAGGAGAGAAAGYGATQFFDEKEQKKLEKQHEKEEKAHQKEVEKQEKAHQKEVAKQEKQHEKEVAKQEKQHEKEVAKQEKQHEKEAAKHQKEVVKEEKKAEKQHEKEISKQEKHQEKEIAKEEKEAEKEQKKHNKEAAAAAGTAGAGGAGAYEAEKHHEEASSGQQGRSSYDSNETDHSGEKKRGLLDKILHPTRKSEDDSRVAADEDGHNKLHKKHVPKSSEQTQDSSPLVGSSHPEQSIVPDSEYGAGREGTAVTEPHTGLPMNTAQYGSGAGGTDGAQQIPGYHEHSATAPGTTGEGSAIGPDWNAIKKENTPY